VTPAVAMLVRWIALGALAGLVGGLAIEVLALRADDVALSPVRRRLRGWTVVCLCVLALTCPWTARGVRNAWISGAPIASGWRLPWNRIRRRVQWAQRSPGPS